MITRRLLLNIASFGFATIASIGMAVTPASAAGETLDPANPVTLTVGVPGPYGYLSTLWARDVQIPGVNVDYKYFPSLGDLLSAQAAGAVDIAESADLPFISSWVNGTRIKIVASTEPYASGLALLVPKDSTAQTFADLKGKRLINYKAAQLYLFFLTQVKAAGLSPDDFITLQVNPGPDSAQAFVTGQADGIYAGFAQSAQFEQEYGARVLETSAQYDRPDVWLLAVTDSAIETKRAAVAAFVQEYANAIAWARGNPKEQAEVVAPKLGFTESAFEAGYSRLHSTLTGLQPIDDAYRTQKRELVDELVEAGLLDKPVDVDAFYLSDFNDHITPGTN